MQQLRLSIFFKVGACLLLFLILLAIDALCYNVALPLKIDIHNKSTTLTVGTQTIATGFTGIPTSLQFTAHDPVVHEYQLDGTDSTNNYTLNTTYLHRISSSFYYRFQAWMRDLAGTSRWRDLQIWNNNHLVTREARPIDGSALSLPAQGSSSIQFQLQRPETPMSFQLVADDGTGIAITIDRNDRQIAINRLPAGTNTTPATTFFPLDPQPFTVMVLDFLTRTLLWSIIALVIVTLGEGVLAIFQALWERWKKRLFPQNASFTKPQEGLQKDTTEQSAWWNRKPFLAIHPLAWFALAASFIFVSWISLVQYNAEPHIYDASAYLFAARMYAQGHLSVPVPPALDRFPGPFMDVAHGQWFGQYAPGTAITLVPGIWLGVPWLVEPLLGTLALLGTGLIAARLYNRKVASLAVVLGTLSPFYSYLAASYLSHAIALFYLVWGTWAFLRFAQGKAGWNLLLSAFLFGMAGLTRDLVAVLYVFLIVVGIMMLCWRKQQRWTRWILPGLCFLAIASFIFFGITRAFNQTLTGNPSLSPRALFFAGDRWGFGQGIGFYGQHTLAAGLVNLDELLTILAIDLFGWPFYLSLAFLALPFLTLRAKGADWLMLAMAMLMTGAYTGYFYHGIYLGPRYLFETLPFLLILTARGIFTLAESSLSTIRDLRKWLIDRGMLHSIAPLPGRSIATAFLVSVLLLCNLIYFLPRQIELHREYNGLPAGYSIDLPTIYHSPLHHAIVVSNDYTIYQFVLFPLNDPLLRGNIIYAWASNTADYQELRTAFPGRELYQLQVNSDGSVQYIPVSS